MMRRQRRRRGRRGRIPTPVFIERDPEAMVFEAHPPGSGEPVVIFHDEFEALRLVDLEDLTQEEAGKRMGISRGTIWRLLHSARKKTALAFTEGRTIRLPRDHVEEIS